jgi:hypothetical protein
MVHAPVGKIEEIHPTSIFLDKRTSVLFRRIYISLRLFTV